MLWSPAYLLWRNDSCATYGFRSPNLELFFEELELKLKI